MSLPIGRDLTVVDLGLGFGSAVIARQMAEAGAKVVRILPRDGDPFGNLYPAYEALKAAADIRPDSELETWLASADVCLIGGEDYPGLAHTAWTAAALEARFPRLVVVQLGGSCDGQGYAVELLVQARTGVVFEQLPDRPVRFAVAMATFGQALAALAGLWAALIDRDRSGRGQTVQTSLEQGLALFWSQIWMEAERADALFDKLPPRGVQHLIFQCADGGYIHFVLGVPGALAKLYGVLQIDVEVDPNERGIPTLARGPQSYFADRSLLEPVIANWRRADLVKALNDAGLAAEPALLPGEAWDSAQVVVTGLIRDQADGKRLVGQPFRFAAVPVRGDAAWREARWCEAPDARSGPLTHLRVIDLGNFIAGPFASKVLADLGADVVRVEPPGSLAALTGLRNTWASNRGKRSIVIDMKQAAGLALTHRLCAAADIVTHNFRLGVAERLGVDPQRLRKLRPDIVTLETTGYGSTGPRAPDAGWDMVMQALCGHETRAGGEGNAPMWYRTAVVDFATGMVGAIGALMGVYARDHGMGSVAVENSLLATALFLMSELVETSDGRRVGATLLDSERLGFSAAERLYQTLDGWIAVAARGADMVARLHQCVGLESSAAALLSDTEFAERIASAFAGRSTADALAQLAASDVWAEPCASDAWSRLKANGAAAEAGLLVQATDESYGEIIGAFGTFVNFSRTRVHGPFRSAPVQDNAGTEIRDAMELV